MTTQPTSDQSADPSAETCPEPAAHTPIPGSGVHVKDPSFSPKRRLPDRFELSDFTWKAPGLDDEVTVQWRDILDLTGTQYFNNASSELESLMIADVASTSELLFEYLRTEEPSMDVVRSTLDTMRRRAQAVGTIRDQVFGAQIIEEFRAQADERGAQVRSRLHGIARDALREAGMLEAPKPGAWALARAIMGDDAVTVVPADYPLESALFKLRDVWGIRIRESMPEDTRAGFIFLMLAEYLMEREGVQGSDARAELLGGYLADPSTIDESEAA